jgi:hypothetical protein
MRLPLAALLIFPVAFFTVTAPVAAHHGTGVAYLPDKFITLQGTVTDWIWSNPHCGILFDVTDDQGNVVHWGAELGNPHLLSSAGFSKDIFKPGDKITITGHPSKTGAPRLEFHHVALPDGRVLTSKGFKGNGERVEGEN